MHFNKHIKAGFAGGKTMRIKSDKKLSPHGEGSGLPKAKGVVKSGVNNGFIQKMKGRNKMLLHKIKTHRKDTNRESWKVEYKKRQADIIYFSSTIK